MTQSPVRTRCGEQYLFTRAHKGNYRRDCRGSWAVKPRSEEAPRPRPQRSRMTSSIYRREDDERSSGLESPYNEA